jgi:hypothetical protein
MLAGRESVMKDRFALIFVSTVGLTALCGVIMGAIAIFGPDPQPVPIAAMFDTLKYGFTVGMLSIFGLLGTKVTPPSNQ